MVRKNAAALHQSFMTSFYACINSQAVSFACLLMMQLNTAGQSKVLCCRLSTFHSMACGQFGNVWQESSRLFAKPFQNLVNQTAGGKQLLCEAVGLLGSLLLVMDRRLQSPVRERLVVAYYRLRGGSQAVGPSANAVIALCASTGLDAARKRSPPGDSFGAYSCSASLAVKYPSPLRTRDGH